LKEEIMCDHDDGFDGLDWEDIALIGALSESLAVEEKERERIRKEMGGEQEEDEKSDEDL
jgi:hypothetical protein